MSGRNSNDLLARRTADRRRAWWRSAWPAAATRKARCRPEPRPVAEKAEPRPQRSQAALEESLRHAAEAPVSLADNAKAILVFPSITKAGLGIGGLYGNGTMFEGGKPVGYYNIAGGTFGLQIGAQSFSQATSSTPPRLSRPSARPRASSSAPTPARSPPTSAPTRRSRPRPCRSPWWWRPGASPASWRASTIEGAKITEINP